MISLQRPTGMRANGKSRVGFAVAGIAGLAVLAAGCGGSSSGGQSTVSSGSGSGAPAAVSTHSGPDGAYLTDASGRTLYFFAKDTGTSSTCSGSCTGEWPPLTTSGAPTASGGAQSSMLGTTSRSDGTTQVTYNGHPVYMFSGDSSTGDMNGNGLDDFGGTWSVAGQNGSPLAAAQPSSTPSSSGGGGSEWG